MSEADHHRNWMMERCNLFGQIGMIVCWYWDGNDNGEDFDETAVRGVQLLPKLISGETAKFSPRDWLIFYEALGGYTPLTLEMEELYQFASDGQEGKLRGKNTKSYLWVKKAEDDKE